MGLIKVMVDLRTVFLYFWLLVFPTMLFAGSNKVNIQDIPKKVVLEETGDVLNLRGIAVCKHFFSDSYLLAFYSLNQLKDEKEALADGGPKRMILFFLEPVDNLRQILESAISDNNSPDVIQREQLSISQFLKIIDNPLHEGDTLVLDYIPNVGTKIIIKGVVHGTIKGSDFNNLILKVWMGRQPPSKKFRKDLFNLTQGIHL